MKMLKRIQSLWKKDPLPEAEVLPLPKQLSRLAKNAKASQEASYQKFLTIVVQDVIEKCRNKAQEGKQEACYDEIDIKTLIQCIIELNICDMQYIGDCEIKDGDVLIFKAISNSRTSDLLNDVLGELKSRGIDAKRTVYTIYIYWE